MSTNIIFHNTSFFSDKIFFTIFTMAFFNCKWAAILESLGAAIENLFPAKK